MGAYSQAVQVLAPLNLAVIPTCPDKPSVPLMRNPEKLGVPGSLKLAGNPRFERANAGIWTGHRANLTVVDIDSANPADVIEAVRRFGNTPLKVLTPSGGIHLYFRHNGERRKVRPFGSAVPIDLLGN